MTFFVVGFAEIAIVIVVLIAILAGTAEVIVGMTNIFIGLFAIKNLIQTIVFGYFKNKNPLSYTIGFTITDFARMFVFFYVFRIVGLRFVEARGLGFLGALFDLILYFVCCGSIFMLGEFVSLVQAFGDTRPGQNDNNKGALLGSIFLVVVMIGMILLGSM